MHEPNLPQNIKKLQVCTNAPHDTINATWIKSQRNHFLWIRLIKFNNECASKCILHWLEQTELKYGEALVHSDS